MTPVSEEKKIWDLTAEMHGNYSVPLSQKTSQQFLSAPTELIKRLSRYKFAAKMGCKKGAVLEIGCGAGFGAPILGEFAETYLGIDTDEAEIESARANLPKPKFCFECAPLDRVMGQFDGIVSLTQTPCAKNAFLPFLAALFNKLKENGLLVLGCPSFPHEELTNRFHHVFSFSMNRETVRAGIDPFSEYCLVVCFHKKMDPS